MLSTEKHFSLYEAELNRYWPSSDKSRERKIKQFAKENGWKVQIIDLGLCAIFSKDGAAAPDETADYPGDSRH